MFRMSHVSYIPTGPQENSPFWPYYSSKWTNMTSLPPDMALGQYWELQGGKDGIGGNAFMLVKAAAALSVGEVVTNVGAADALHDTGTVTNAGSSTTRIVLGSITVAANDVNSILWIDKNAANATLDQTGGSDGATTVAAGACFRPVKAYVSATTVDIAGRDFNIPSQLGTSNINDINALVAAPTNATVATMVRPYTVVPNTAVSSNVGGTPCGVALGYVASGKYTIIQVAGLAAVCCNGNSPNIVQGMPLKPFTTAGMLMGATAGATPFMGGGSAIALGPNAGNVTDLTDTACLVPCFINFFGNI